MTARITTEALIAMAAASPASPASFRLNSTTPSVSVPEDQSSAETVSSLKATRKTISAETAAAGARIGPTMKRSICQRLAPSSLAASS